MKQCDCTRTVCCGRGSHFGVSGCAVQPSRKKYRHFFPLKTAEKLQ